MVNFTRDQDRNRKALLIGNDNYVKLDFLKPLADSLNDVADLEEKLNQMGFTVSKAVNSSKKEMETNIGNFNKNIEAGDIIVFSFSGHGSEQNGENILYPIDTNTVSDIQQFHTVTINAQNVLDGILKKEPYFVLFLLDCCRGYDHQRLVNEKDKFPESRAFVKMKVQNEDNRVRGLLPPSSWLFLLACDTDKFAKETKSDRRNGHLTFHLVRHISRKEHIGDIITKVCQDVIDNTNLSQIPHHQSNFTNGSVYLNKYSFQFEGTHTILLVLFID